MSDHHSQWDLSSPLPKTSHITSSPHCIWILLVMLSLLLSFFYFFIPAHYMCACDAPVSLPPFKVSLCPDTAWYECSLSPWKQPPAQNLNVASFMGVVVWMPCSCNKEETVFTPRLISDLIRKRVNHLTKQVWEFSSCSGNALWNAGKTALWGGRIRWHHRHVWGEWITRHKDGESASWHSGCVTSLALGDVLCLMLPRQS